MRFLITIYVNRETDAAWEGPESAALQKAHDDVQAELRASGEIVDSDELDPEGARVVRRRDGRSIITDGPFTEAREIAGGYYVVDCADLDRATAIAARFEEARFGPVEVRRLVHASSR
jgi:hypothetical protein